MNAVVRRALLACGLAVASLAAQAAPPAEMLQRGEQLYGRCLACHAIEQNRTGPAHCGLFGRRAGTAPGYNTYSPALRGSGIVWDDASLARFLTDPTRVVPGTTMTYLGMPNAQERDALIAWLKQATQPGRSCSPPGP